MSQQTFTLSQDFSDEIFRRFYLALAELKSDEKLVEAISVYSKVTRDDISSLLASAFWASLSPEEGRYHTFRISFGPPHEFGSNYSLLQAQIYSPEQISDLASVLTNTTRSIGVWYSETGSLEVWGLADISYWDITVTATSPGQLLFSMLAPENGFNLAMSGSWWGVVDKLRTPLDWAYVGGTRPSFVGIESIEIMGRSMKRSLSYGSIARTMLSHKHGGTLIIVREDNNEWRKSCAMRYESASPFRELRENVDRWESEIKKHVDAGQWLTQSDFERERAAESSNLVAQLTAVDGATIISRELEVYGFGAKLIPLNPNSRPENIRLSTPFEGAPYKDVKLSDLGGTRHQSAAQFVYDHKGCVAIVCSQDGRVSAMHWDPSRNTVIVITNLEHAL